MKKLITTISAVLLVVLAATGVIAASSDNLVGKAIQGVFPVTVNGTALSQQAIVIDGTSYLPVRAVADALNLNVSFENNTVILESSAGANQNGSGANGGERQPGGQLNDLASILGMTTTELQSSLQAGSTLEQFAASKGMTMDQLKEAWLANKKTELDSMVAQGKMTSEQAQEMLTRLSEMDLSKMGVGPGMGGGGPMGQPPTGSNQ